ncbi:MAG: GNAT family N-acetyltransferase, partial [Mobilitalea sp.]
VGYVLFHNGYDPDEMSGPIVYIIDLFVTQEQRTKGIGKLLIDKVSEYCKGNGINLMYLYCWKKNIDAMMFYDKIKCEQITDLAFYKIQNQGIQET